MALSSNRALNLMRIAMILTCIVACFAVVACQPVTPQQRPEARRYPSRHSDEDTYDYPLDHRGGSPEDYDRDRADRGNRYDDRDRVRGDERISEGPEPRDVRSTSSSHPRLMVSDDDLARVKQLVQDDPVARQWFAILRERAEKFFDESPQALARPKNGAMISVSRNCLVRVPTLAGLYRLTGDERYARKAIQDMLLVCRLEDWQPSDFLATAEMTNAVSIGYDWCYAAMSPEERARIRDGLVEKGLRPGLEQYQSNQGWTTARHNWNLVCNGGLIVGALALQTEESRLSRSILAQARESIRNGMACYAPDGGWEEGPTYWNYATRYAAFALASLKTATGNVWNLTFSPGFANTGTFRAYVVGPTGKPFNFGDCEENLGNAPSLMWLAQAVSKPVYAAYEQREAEKDPGIFDLMWYRPVDPRLVDRLPLAARFRGVEMGSMRGSWDDPDTTYVAFKAGSNEAHHGHLDMGTFVLDSQGQRWVTALGADKYELPGYFAERRWSYYRCSTRGQNTVLLDNRNQDPQGHGSILSFTPGDHSLAVLDLSDGYRGYARRLMRGFSLINGREVLVQDEIDLSDTSEVRWVVHTKAEIDLTPQVARMQLGGRTMTIQLLSPERGARFEVQSVNIPPPQEPAPQGLKKLVIRIPEARGKVRIAVLFTPGDRPSPNVRLTPLNQWIAGR